MQNHAHIHIYTYSRKHAYIYIYIYIYKLVRKFFIAKKCTSRNSPVDEFLVVSESEEIADEILHRPQGLAQDFLYFSWSSPLVQGNISSAKSGLVIT